MSTRDRMRSSGCMWSSSLIRRWRFAAFGTVALRERRRRSEAGRQAVETTRLTIEVTGGDEKKPVAEASVYVKYVVAVRQAGSKKIELNLKTNQEGVTHSPEIPQGKVLIQIVAPGWKTFGQYYDVQTMTSKRFKFIWSARRRSGIKRGRDFCWRAVASARPCSLRQRENIRMRCQLRGCMHHDCANSTNLSHESCGYARCEKGFSTNFSTLLLKRAAERSRGLEFEKENFPKHPASGSSASLLCRIISSRQPFLTPRKSRC